ncbi:hypothetical protein [Kangiella marina]|uniref:Uncharacterized protein n=1 Tax=Kangiella marina TaxID=1079178 RepID=A0ABP8ILE6_9GAMM
MNLKSIIIVVLIILALLCLPFFIELSFLSTYNSYAAGVLSPIAILLAIWQIRASNNQTNTQLQNLKNQISQSSLIQSLEKIDSDIQIILNNIQITINGDESNLSEVLISDPLPAWQYIIPDYSKLDSFANEQELKLQELLKDKTIKLIITAVKLCRELKKLRNYCDELHSISNNNAIQVYYSTKYKLLNERLCTKGYPIKAWDPNEYNR